MMLSLGSRTFVGIALVCLVSIGCSDPLNDRIRRSPKAKDNSVVELGGQKMPLCASGSPLDQLKVALTNELDHELHRLEQEIGIALESELVSPDRKDRVVERLLFKALLFKALYCSKERPELTLWVPSQSTRLIQTLISEPGSSRQRSQGLRLRSFEPTNPDPALTKRSSTWHHRVRLNLSQFVMVMNDGSLPGPTPGITGTGEVSPVALLLAEIVELNRDPEDVTASIFQKVDKSMLVEEELWFLVRSSGFEHWNGEQLDEDFGLYSAYWSNRFDRNLLKTLHSAHVNVYQNWIGVDGVNKLIFEKKYKTLKALASAANSNTVSYSTDFMTFETPRDWRYGPKSLPLGQGLTTYGLSPLMVAEVLGDAEAVEILTSIEGIQPNLPSPTLEGATWSSIREKSTPLAVISEIQKTNSVETDPLLQGSVGPARRLPHEGQDSFFGGLNPQREPESALTGCAGCTKLMMALKQNRCDLVHRLAEESPQFITERHRDGRSPIEFSLDEGNLCLVDLVELGAPLIGEHEQVGRQMAALLTLIGYREREVFRVVPDPIWVELTDPQIEHLARHEFGLRDQPRPDYPMFERMKEVGIVKPKIYDKIFTEYLISLTDREEEASFATGQGMHPVDKFPQMKELGFNPNAARGRHGLTIFDRVLSFRGTQAVVGRPLGRAMLDLEEFSTWIQRTLEIEPAWLTEWVNGQTFFGYNPTSLLAAYNEKDMLRTLAVIPGFDPNLRCQKSGYTPLDWSVMRMKFVEFPLLDSGVNFNLTVNGFNGMWYLLIDELGAVESHDFVSARDLKPELNLRFEQLRREFLNINRSDYDPLRFGPNPTPFFQIWAQTRIR